MTLDKPIAIVDIETTGGSNRFNSITEIAIIITDGVQIIDEYSTLINPGRKIPTNITRLTGISDSMVADAPYFEDVAEKIYQMFDGCYFMAHYAVFDFSFIKRQLKECGLDFRPRLLCSVKLSRKLFPEVKGHSLEAIINRNNIAVDDRHRAYADTRAVYDFIQLSINKHGHETVADALKSQLKYKSLPSNLSSKALDGIKNETGVYIFRDEQNVPIYIGKSINLRNRVLSHFSQSTDIAKEMKISSGTHKVETIKTKSEIEALLLESRLIKEMLPVHNRRLRRVKKSALLLHALNSDGYKTVELFDGNTKDIDDISKIIAVLPDRRSAKAFLLSVRDKYALCSKLLGLENVRGACFMRQLKKCSGACVNEEPNIIYNLKFDTAFKYTSVKSWPYKSSVALLIGDNRRLIVNNWIPIKVISEDSADILSHDNDFSIDTYKILESFIRRNPEKVISQ